jgi:hypothetical protein
MNTPYRILYSPAVKAFFSTLSPRSKRAVKDLLVLIAQAPQFGAPVRSEEGILYQKTYDVPIEEFSAGIRVFYQIFETEIVIAVINLGDHTTCAVRPGQSVYRDERRSA